MEATLQQPQKKVKLQVMNGVHHVRNEALSRKGTKEHLGYDAITTLEQINTGGIIEVDANSREARDADPGTPEKPNPYFTGKFRRVWEEEIGQQANESPQQAAARLRRMAEQIERDAATVDAKPAPTQREIELAQETLARAGMVQNQQPQLPNSLPADNPIQQAAQAGFSGNKRKFPDFDKLSDKELLDFVASEEIEIKDTSKRAEVLKAVKQWAARK